MASVDVRNETGQPVQVYRGSEEALTQLFVSLCYRTCDLVSASRLSLIDLLNLSVYLRSATNNPYVDCDLLGGYKRF